MENHEDDEKLIQGFDKNANLDIDSGTKSCTKKKENNHNSISNSFANCCCCNSSSFYCFQKKIK